MKQLVTISFFVLFIHVNNASAQSQVNVIHRMDKQGLRWTEGYGVQDDPTRQCPNWWQTKYEYYTNGDTIVNGKKYTKFYYSTKYTIAAYSDQQCYRCDCNYTYDVKYFKGDTVIVGGLREDSTGKVFFYGMDTTAYHKSSRILYQPFNKEVLLYNFNWKVGDTLPYKLYDNSVDSVIAIVQNIDSVILYDGSFRKRLNMSSIHEIVEGIGSSESLLGVFMIQPFEAAQSIICFRDSGKYLYPDRTFTDKINIDCDSSPHYNTATKEIITSKDFGFKVFPNPANSITYINLLTQTPGSTLQVYNITGSLLKTQSISKPNAQIDVSSYANGVYVLKLTDKHGVTYVQRLIVNR